MTAKIIYLPLSQDAIFAGLSTGGICPLNAAQGKSRPYTTYYLVDVNPTKTKGNTSRKDFKRVQLDFWADNYDTAEQMADRAREVLDGLYGTVGGIRVRIDFENENDAKDKQSRAARKSTDYIIRQQR